LPAPARETPPGEKDPTVHATDLLALFTAALNYVAANWSAARRPAGPDPPFTNRGPPSPSMQAASRSLHGGIFMDNRKRGTHSSPAAFALVINGTLTGIGAVFVTTASVAVTALATLAAVATAIAFMCSQR
jgi:hypothetical protein